MGGGVAPGSVRTRKFQCGFISHAAPKLLWEISRRHAVSLPSTRLGLPYKSAFQLAAACFFIRLLGETSLFPECYPCLFAIGWFAGNCKWLLLLPDWLLFTLGGWLLIAGGVLGSAKPLQKSSLGVHRFWAWASKKEAWRRDNCTVYAESGQLCTKGMNQWREASHPKISTVPRLQLYDKQCC